MLLSFRFANHRSFRDEQQLNLTPVYEDDPATTGEHEAVRVVGIFGANASGKSNALRALTFMRLWAIRSDREVEPGLGLDREPFRLDQAYLTEPSRYVVDLLLDGVRYTYGFTINNERVLEEWLYYYPLKKKRRVFERDADEFKWGEASGRQGDLERIAEITAPTALFLSTSARFGRNTGANDSPARPLHDVYRWFRRFRTRHQPGVSRLAPVTMEMWSEIPDGKSTIVALLRAADVGIVDIVVKHQPIQESLFPPDVSDIPQDEVAEPAVRRTRVPPRPRTRVQFAHRGSRGNVLLDISDESTGTRQLLDLAVDASIILAAGGTMTVDEIDASLHPMLTARLIGLFQSPASNPFVAQLIFTSHDAALLGTVDTEEILHRDQIWFSEKEADGASVLYPLSDFKPRKAGENRQRRYMNGNYGAVPDLSADLFEQAVMMRRGRDGETA
jgi:uncharacterized protein